MARDIYCNISWELGKPDKSAEVIAPKSTLNILDDLNMWYELADTKFTEQYYYSHFENSEEMNVLKALRQMQKTPPTILIPRINLRFNDTSLHQKAIMSRFVISPNYPHVR